MRRIITVLTLAAALIAGTSGVANAGSAHFVDGTVTATRTGDTLTATGKIAGLGDEDQVHVALSATAACVNPGGNKPSAGNKQTVTAEGDFPTQNGKAYFDLTVTAVFQPSCSPPMTVVYSDVTVTAAGITAAIPGTF
jgi:hypothetical protein